MGRDSELQVCGLGLEGGGVGPSNRNKYWPIVLLDWRMEVCKLVPPTSLVLNNSIICTTSSGRLEVQVTNLHPWEEQCVLEWQQVYFLFPHPNVPMHNSSANWKKIVSSKSKKLNRKFIFSI